MRRLTSVVKLIGVVLCVDPAAVADEVEEAWVARYDGPGWQSSFAQAIAVDQDGNTFVSGQTQDVNRGTSTILTLKYDGGGHRLWDVDFDEGQQSWPVALATDGPGALYLAGAVIVNNQPQRLLLVKYGADGGKLWSDRYAPGGRIWSEAAALAVDDSGSVYVTGTCGGDSADYLTVKYDPDGNQCWSRLYDADAAGVDQPSSLAVDALGNVYVTGSSTAFGRQGFLTLKYDPDGHEVWSVRYDGNGQGEIVGRPRTVAVDAEGHVYVAGQSAGGPGNWWSVPWDFLTLKYDADGNEVWLARYDGPDRLSDDVVGLAIDPEGSVIVTGNSQGRGGWSFVTIKYDPSGNEVWIADYGADLRGGGASAASLAVDASGFPHVFGSVEGPQGSGYVSVQYDPSGNEVWIAPYGEDGVYEYAVASAVDADGRLHVTGNRSDSFGTCILMLEYDAEGNELWIAHHQNSHGGNDEAVALAIDAEGNAYAAGITATQNRPGGDYVTVKYDAQGTMLWEERYDHVGQFADTPSAMTIDGDGNVYVTGMTRPPDTSFADFLTVKYDGQGRRIWTRTYSEPYQDKATAIAADAAGEVIVTGSSRTGNGAGTEDFATVKYDASGEVRWIARHDGPHGRGDEPVAIAIDASGNVLVVGASRSTTASSSSDYLTVKYDTRGSLQWDAMFAGPDGRSDRPEAIAVDESGGVYVTGTSDSAGSADLLTVKYDAGGNELWVRRYDGPGGQDDEAVAIAVAHDGSVYVAGTVGEGRRRDLAVVRYGPAGDELWSAIYDGPNGNADWPSDLVVDPRGGLIVTGASRSSGAATSADFLTMKYDVNGRMRWIRTFDGDASRDEAVAVAIAGPGCVYVAGSSRRAALSSDQDIVVIRYVETVTAPVFLRGDCDGDGRVAGTVSDAVFLLRYNFARGPAPPCLAACDANGDGEVHGQVADAVYLLAYSFAGGAAPAPPFPECAPGDLEGDEILGCELELEDCE